jgi:hypothetical protein
MPNYERIGKSKTEKLDTNLVLMKVGADPEALFYSQSQKIVVPAHQFCGGRSAMSSWIGTDGHSATAEFRPVPSRNVLMVVADLALAMGEVEKALVDLNSRSKLNVAMVAQPYFKNEPLGGHIHLSYWASKDLFAGSRMNPDNHDYGKVYAQLLHFASPLMERIRLGGTHRSDGYSYRAQPSPRNATHPPHVGMAAMRIEFRHPGTWLASPVLAFACLGMAKLALMNFPLLPRPTHYIEDLRSFKSTSDLVTLVDTVDWLMANPPTFTADNPLLVDFNAWRNVLATEN